MLHLWSSGQYSCGLVDGDSLGDELGAADGKDVVGCIIGPPVSSAVGLELGASDGDSLGLADGDSLGDELEQPMAMMW